MTEMNNMTKQKAISFTVKNRETLRKCYDQAVASNKEKFTFLGHELLTSYAKYLLQFLDSKA